MNATVEIEKNQRLSKSILWKLQSDAYCQFGPEAWSHKGVPFYVTSNPSTAFKYANIVLGYLRDCLAPGATTPLDLKYPVYIFDLGAGSGRFGYLFLKCLFTLLELPILSQVKIRYVMTDIAQKNTDFLQNHPYLRPFIEEGILDFSYYRHDQDNPLKLILDGAMLTQATVQNPVVVIGNYFFDTIPQDLFRKHNKQLEEGRITIKVKKQDGVKPEGDEIISKMDCEYDYIPLKLSKEYFSNFPLLTDFLNKYASKIVEKSFLFPVGAFQVIQYFSDLSKNRLLLIAGDQGVCTLDQVFEAGEPVISKHASFSIPVNYHAIAQYLEEGNGAALMSSFPNPEFIVMAGIMGGTQEKFPATEVAYRAFIDDFEPTDSLELVNCVERENTNPSLELIFLLLKLSKWDPMVFNAFYPQIQNKLPKASKNRQEQYKEAIHCVWENFYPVSKEEGNFVMNLGVLFYEIKDHEQALIYLKRSLDIMGETPKLLQNIIAVMQKR